MENPLNGLKLEVAISSGIPEAYTATLNFITKTRESLDLDIRRRYDLLNLWLCEQFWGLFGYKPPPS
jgi:hypothetical protein